MPQHFETERLILKRHTLDFAERIFKVVDAERSRLRQFLPWVDLTLTLEDERNYIKSTQTRWSNFEQFDYSLFRKSDAVFLGTCGIHNISWQNERCELGYWIGTEFEGQGYISESVKGLEGIIYDLGFHRIEIRCSVANSLSADVARRNGYSLDGTLREDSFENGTRRSTHIFAKLKTES